MPQMLAVMLIAVLGASGFASDPFEATTPGVAGSGRVVPALTGSGPASPNSANMLLLADAAPNAPALLVFSMSELAAPFAGGVLGPAPDFIASLGATDARGAIEYRFRMPPDAPVGLKLWMQMWVTDAGGVAGMSASNTVRAAAQPHTPTSLLFAGHMPLAGYSPFGGVLADFDADGYLDGAYAAGFPGDSAIVILPGCADGSFGAPIEISAPGAGTGLPLSTGDLNGDGHLDLVGTFFTASLTDVLATYLGDGTGNFTVMMEEPVSPFARHTALLDLDTDGVLDLVLGNRAGAGPFLDLRLGQGDGTFVPSSSVSVSDEFTAMLSADMNADGLLDIVTAGQGAASVFLGDGVGGFHFLASFPCDPSALFADVADINSDGHLDVVVTNSTDRSLSVLLGLGDGALAPPITSEVDGVPYDIWLGDLNNDNVPDAIVSSRKNTLSFSNGRVEVLLGVGDGTFSQTFPLIMTTLNAFNLLAGKLGADEFTDIQVIVGPAALATFHGQGDGKFLAAPRFGVGPGPDDLVAGDFDGDGNDDFAIVRKGFLTLRLGVGNSSFGPQVSVPLDFGASRLRSADLDDDGDLDIVHWTEFVSPRVRVQLNQGDGSFGAAQALLAGGDLHDVRLADIDADGDLDIVGNFTDLPGLWTAKQLAPGDFADPIMIAAIGNLAAFTLSDFNTDGITDLALLSDAGALNLRFGLGDDSFTPPQPVAALAELRAPLDAADLNGDGLPDLFVGTANSALSPLGLLILPSLGNGSFGEPIHAPTPLGVPGNAAPAVGDLTGDGHVDIALTTTDSLKLLRGHGDGSFDAPESFLGGSGASGLGLADFDHDGRLDAAVSFVGSDNVWLYLNQHPD